MTDSPTLERAIACIEADTSLKVFFEAPPQVVLMPFARETHRSYLTVVVFLIDQALNLETVAFVCTRIIELLDEGDLLQNQGGVEVMPCINRDGAVQRVVRVSVLSKSLEKAKTLRSGDLRLPKPAEGITSHLYLKGISG